MAQSISLSQAGDCPRNEAGPTVEGSVLEERRGGGADRRLAIKGTRNMRDIGGYVAASGKMTRWGRLLRADALVSVDAAGWRQLAELGVRRVYDVREVSEIRQRPVATPPAEILVNNIPLLASGLDRRSIVDLGDFYARILDRCGSNLAAIIRVLAESEESIPAVLHCSAGKDRTGVIIAVLLRALGVSPEDIVRDYAMTAAAITPSFREMMRARSASNDFSPAVAERLLGSPPEAMERTLEHLETRYGGAVEYLHGNGLGDQDLVALDERLLGPGVGGPG